MEIHVFKRTYADSSVVVIKASKDPVVLRIFKLPVLTGWWDLERGIPIDNLNGLEYIGLSSECDIPLGPLDTFFRKVVR